MRGEGASTWNFPNSGPGSDTPTCLNIEFLDTQPQRLVPPLPPLRAASLTSIVPARKWLFLLEARAQSNLETPLSTGAFLHPGLSPMCPLGPQPPVSAMASNLPPCSLLPSVTRPQQTPCFFLAYPQRQQKPRLRSWALLSSLSKLVGDQGPRAGARPQAFFCRVLNGPLHRDNSG